MLRIVDGNFWLLLLLLLLLLQPTFGTARQFLIIASNPKHPTLCVRRQFVSDGAGRALANRRPMGVRASNPERRHSPRQYRSYIWDMPETVIANPSETLKAIDEIVDNFSLLDEWDDRYRYVIELGRSLGPLPDRDRTEANKVQGCASQVWLATTVHPDGRGGTLVLRRQRCSHRARANRDLVRNLFRQAGRRHSLYRRDCSIRAIGPTGALNPAAIKRVDVEATPARTYDEVAATKTMI